MRTIDLSGPQGNAFALLGIAAMICHKTGREWEPIRKDMTHGDYHHLIAVFEREFKAFYKLENKPKEVG